MDLSRQYRCDLRKMSFTQLVLFFLWMCSSWRPSETCSTRPAPRSRASPPFLPPASTQHGARPHHPHQQPYAGSRGTFHRSPSRNNTSQQGTLFRDYANSSSRNNVSAISETTTALPRFDCPATYQKWYCLNGATCFTVKLSDTILYNCKCVEGYMGQRCEYKDTTENYGYIRSRYMVKRAGIASGLTAAFILVVILTISIALYVRRRKERAQQQLPTSFSPDDLKRIPFARVLSRTEQFKVGRPSKDSRHKPESSSLHEIPEQGSSLLPNGNGRTDKRAPLVRLSDAYLVDEDAEDGQSSILPEDAHMLAGPSPHPYSVTESESIRLEDIRRNSSSFLNFAPTSAETQSKS